MCGRKIALFLVFLLTFLLSDVGIKFVSCWSNSGYSSEHLIDVPFHYQDIEYYCGPAALQMVFDYYGEDINQSEIADVARTIGEPVYSTFTTRHPKPTT
jgi:hypothetical protein